MKIIDVEAAQSKTIRKIATTRVFNIKRHPIQKSSTENTTNETH